MGFLQSALLAGAVVQNVAGHVVSTFEASERMMARQPVANGSWPYGPFTTKGRDIVNAHGETVQWAGVNWPGSGETMVPEGVEWSSVEDILDLVKSVGFNFIRLTYAIEMVDQIYERNGTDVPLEVAMITALGYENGTKVTKEMVAKNKGWTKDTGRFEVWDHIAEAALERGMYVHPDVHVGKAQWCCNNTDGNAWFDDYNFPVKNWHRGLQYVAEWAKKHPNVVSMALRNELRRAINTTAPTSTTGYDWLTFVGNFTAATDAIYSVNPDILVTWSGLQYDQDLSALTTGLNLNTAPLYKGDAIRDGYRRDPVVFDLAAHPWGNNVVYELHLYSMSENLDTGNCPIIEAELYQSGFNALGMSPPSACNITKNCPEAVRQTPVILSEFGSAQDESLLNDTLQGCLREFTTKHNVSWAVWSLAGSYRIRSGGQGVPDTWALSNYEWNGWQYEEGIEKWWKPWVKTSLG
ncbi:hypothetical protein GRF29_28g2903682 [Pseudopithomyces chartarum]|uniref:Glycoside hydrolase family 5 domain-containing protein n=1 Tax=Pseudopithomyces chartarum TaxID=1892770 RepID=A0AAN6M342_9PLEO|nr:hypothetical protein GRF29_28g2903682 [Pseudopithomyces chartarum]